MAAMLNGAAALWRETLRLAWGGIGQMLAAHFAYSALGLILFTPLLGLLGRLLLQLSGRPVLADQEILYFLLSSYGMAALVVASAALITIMLFEQASLMAIAAGAANGVHVGVMPALSFAAARASRVALFAIALVVRVLLLMTPFVLLGAAAAWLLITQHDINYYLSVRPPEFLAVVAISALLLLTMLVLLLRKLLQWSLALPLLLFSDVTVRQSFGHSRQLTRGRRRVILVALLIWALAALLLGGLLLAAVKLLGSLLAPLFFDSMKWLVVVLGGIVLLWGLGNLVVTSLTSGSFAALLVAADELCAGEVRSLKLARRPHGGHWRLSAPRLLLLLSAAACAATFTGVWLLNGVAVHDDTVIVAHRGAAGVAPENTLASIRRAIDDGADWVEIDVQESRDGEVVVVHDSDFMKLAGIDLKVWDGSLEQIQQIDVGSWFDAAYADQRVPTLAQVLGEVRGRSRLVIELKYYGYDRQLEQRVVDLVEAAGMAEDVVIMSLEYAGIEKIRALRPAWVVGLLSAQALGNLARLDVDFLAVNSSMATANFIRRSRASGKRVFVWTLNDPVNISRMMSLGVDGIITDEPRMARRVVAERADMGPVERLLVHTAVLFGQPVPPRLYRDNSP
jgi:glycerophosphoryl diester phosphodiesterase